MTTLSERMQADLAVAMKARDARHVSVLRSTLAALANAEAVVAPRQSSTPVAFGTTEVPRRELDEDEARAIVSRELEELRQTAEDLRRHGRDANADDLDARATILAGYIDG